MSSDHAPFLVVLSSPSGAGKTSICREVVRRDRKVAYSVSATTRPRRKGEAHGRSYWFYTDKRFKDLVRRNGLIEHAVVYDHYYGTPRARVTEQFRRGRDVIADLDIQGMRQCKQSLPGTVAIFVNAPSRTVLARRLRRRGTDSDRVIARREAELKSELAAIPEFDYLVVNDRLESAVDRVLAIIKAERLRTHRLRKGRGRAARDRRKTG